MTMKGKEPAFPAYGNTSGINIREHFAIMVLPAIISDNENCSGVTVLVEEAYRFADEMIKQSERTKS